MLVGFQEQAGPTAEKVNEEINTFMLSVVAMQVVSGAALSPQFELEAERHGVPNLADWMVDAAERNSGQKKSPEPTT